MMKANRTLPVKIKDKLISLLTRNYKTQICLYIYYNLALKRDRKNGVDFTQRLTLAQLGFSEDSESIHYGATRTYEILKVLNSINIKPTDTIMDFGSGKGLSLVNFHRAGFGKICGVELNTDLCRIAENNFKKLGIEGITLINRDATKVKEELDQFNYFFFYNPFRGATFCQVIENIIESKKRKPREITIIYNYPIDKHFIERTNAFNEIYSYIPFFLKGEFKVYRSKNENHRE